MSGIEKLLPHSRTVSIQGTDFEVAPFRVKSVRAVLSGLVPFVAALDPATAADGDAIAGLGRLFAQYQSGQGPENAAGLSLVGLLTSQMDDTISLVAALIGKSSEWVGELNLAELIALAEAAIDVNLDFFIQGVLPQAKTSLARVKQAMHNRQTAAGLAQSTP